MKEILRTNDFVLLSAIEALLSSAGIMNMIFDQHMSVMDGSLGILPRRLMVEADRAQEAEDLIKGAGLWPE